MISLEQIRAARAMLGLSQQELADKAGISTGTLNNIERGVQTDPKLSTITSIQKTLEDAGIEFTISENGEQGVKLKTINTTETKTNKVYTVLVIDDSESDRKLYKAWLSKQKEKNIRVIEAGNAQEGYNAYLKSNPSCIILDFMMYGKDGFQLLVQMKKDQAHMPPIIFVTAMSSETIRKSVLAIGAKDYLDKKRLTREKFCEAVNKILI